MMQAPSVVKILNLIDVSILNLYFISFLKICLYPLEPSSMSIKKSPKIAIVNKRRNITVSNLSFNIVIF